jgi:hypothetical protein
MGVKQGACQSRAVAEVVEAALLDLVEKVLSGDGNRPVLAKRLVPSARIER